MPGVLAKGNDQQAPRASPLLSERRRQRAETMSSVLRSITTGVIVSVAALMILDVVGLPIGPLLASAGIVGVAVGFGAQTLVKDFLSGIFMILEDQYGVGDLVDTGHGHRRHRRGGRPARDPAARRQRRRLVRPQRRDPAGRQPQPGLVDRRSSTCRWPTPRTSSRVQRLIGEVADGDGRGGGLAGEDPRAADRGRRRVGDRDLGDDPGHRQVRARTSTSACSASCASASRRRSTARASGCRRRCTPAGVPGRTPGQP